MILYMPAIAVLVFHCFAMLNIGTFYNSRIDPDYPYLFNGLNCALGAFDRIGHFDHPGTPFQMLTGVFILIVHFFFGQGDLASDVISRPEFYLTGCSFLLSVLGSIVTLYATLKVYEASKNFAASFVLGSSLLLHTLAMNLTVRYIPDYLLLILVLLLAVPIVQYIFKSNYSSIKFAVFTGVVLGIGVITKVVFVPLVFIPFILADKFKNKILYSLVLAISAILSFLPVISRLSVILKYYTRLSKHDGIYGTGEQQFISIEKFLNNLKIFSINEVWYLVIFIGIITFLILTYIKQKPGFFKVRSNKFFLAFILSSILGLILVLKHYKSYYAASLLAIAIIAYIVLWLKLVDTYKHKKLINTILISMVFVHFGFQVKEKTKSSKYQHKVSQSKKLTNEFLSTYIDPNVYRIIKTSWRSNLTVDCGLAYGITYINKKGELYNEFKKAHPKTLSWEGNDKPIRFLRMATYFDNALFYSGEKVYLFPGKYNNAATDIISYLKKGSEERNIECSFDTVFYDKTSKNYLIEYINNSLWHTKNSTISGFEVTKNNTMFANDGIAKLSSNKFNLVQEQKSTGRYSICLSDEMNISPGIYLDTLNKDDYLKLTVKIKGNIPKNKSDLLCYNNMHLPKAKFSIVDSAVTAIDKGWKLIQLGLSCKNKTRKSGYMSICNTGNKPIFVDDFEIDHCSSLK